VSQKTAIDLATLGAPDNDSAGTGCYISERGVQAAPYGIKELRGDVGTYHGSMYMDGITYHIFQNRIINEGLDIVPARFSRFKSDDFSYEPGGTEDLIPDWFFKHGEDEPRPLKAISYMTLTDRDVKFYDIANARVFSLRARNNIVALFSFNAIAFMEEDGEGNKTDLRFVLNPLFADMKDDDLTDRFPMEILALRSWTPLWNNNIDDDGYAMLDPDVALHLKAPADLRLKSEMHILLAEETVFLYEKESRKVRAIRQIRRRCADDSTTDFIGDLEGYDLDTTIANNFFKRTPFITNTYFDYLEYVNRLYLFTEERIDAASLDDGGGTEPAAASEYYGKKWDGSNEPIETIYNIDSSSDFLGFSILDIFDRYPAMRKTMVRSTDKHRIPYFFHNYLDEDKRDVVGYNRGLGAFGDMDISYGLYSETVNTLYRAWTSRTPCLWFNKGDDIDSVLRKISGGLAGIRLATPDNWSRVQDDGTFNGNDNHSNFAQSAWSRVYEIYQSARLRGSRLFRHSQEYLWGQRSRAFSLGTMVKDANPYGRLNDTAGMQIAGWDSVDGTGYNSKPIPGGKEDIAPIELAARTLAIRGRYSPPDPDGSYFIIPALFPVKEKDYSTDLKNAAYFSDVGSFDINTTDQHYEVPSNVSDRLIGVWGEDRDVLFIGTKSIERFNIADSSAAPLSFVRLEKTHDLLLDWSGINGRLDTLTR